MSKLVSAFFSIVIGIGFVALIFGAGTANADCNNGPFLNGCTIYSPGYSDPAGIGYVAQLDATGQLPPPPNFIVAPYSATIGTPVTPGDPMNVSTDQGAQVAIDIYNSLPKNQQIYLRGYSEGAVASVKAANGIICGNFTSCDGAPPPPNVHVSMDGDPNGSTGMLGERSYLVQNGIVGPIVNAFGIQTDITEPANTDRNFHQNDMVAHGGIQDPLGLLTFTTAFPSHAIQNPDAPHVNWEGPNGEQNHEYGVGTNPWTTFAESQGTPIDPGTNAFFNQLNPVEQGADFPVGDQPLVPGLPAAPLPAPDFAPPPGFVPPMPVPVPAFAPLPDPNAPVVPVDLAPPGM